LVFGFKNLKPRFFKAISSPGVHVSTIKLRNSQPHKSENQEFSSQSDKLCIQYKPH